MKVLPASVATLLLLAACESPTGPETPSPTDRSDVAVREPDLSFPGGGRVLFIPNVTSYTGHFGIVDAGGSTTYLGDDRFSFPYWDPADPARLLTLPFDDAPQEAPRVRAFRIAGDELVRTGSWLGSPSFTFVSPDGWTIAFTPFGRSGRLLPGTVRLVDRSSGQIAPARSGTLVPLGWLPDDELMASSGGSLVRWDPWTGDASGFGTPDLWEVVWDPTGRRFAGLSNGGGAARTDLVIGGLDGRIEQRLPMRQRNVVTPTWSPDGHRIAFIVRRHGRHASARASLHVYDVTRRVDRVVARWVSAAFWVSWSPGGRWLLLDDWTRDRWLFVAADGSERIPYPWLGHFPRWCCPSSPPISVQIPVS